MLAPRGLAPTAVSRAELQSQIKPINFATKRKASKNNGRVSAYIACLDSFRYEAGDLTGSAELQDLLHGGKRSPRALRRRWQPAHHGSGQRLAARTPGSSSRSAAVAPRRSESYPHPASSAREDKAERDERWRNERGRDKSEESSGTWKYREARGRLLVPGDRLHRCLCRGLA